MNGWADTTGQIPNPTGRHRRGAGTWTPQVAPRNPGGRHSSAGLPQDPPSRGSLPLLSQILSEGSVQHSEPGFGPVSGQLPIPAQAAEPPRAQPERIGPRGKPRRTKVTLTPPTCHEDKADDDVRVYVATPETGLSTFDLGSVPASVTPPRSWRKAAWFATASSGGVVVALLFAGSALVGKPTPDQAGGGWIPGLGGGIPTVEGEQIVPGPSGQTGGTSNNAFGSGQRVPTSTEVTDSASDAVRSPVRSAALRPPGTSTEDDSSSSSGSSVSTPTTTPVPQKPPSKPASWDADPQRFTVQSPPDPQSLATDSQKYLDAVTEDPEAAHAMTTGELNQEGTDGIERKYSDVAYFQVQHVQVHQYDGKTVCTVKMVRKDGSAVTEQRTLTFSGEKISSDGD